MKPQVEQAVVDDEIDGDVEDENPGAEEEDILFSDAANNIDVDPAETSMDTSAHNILVSAVDPVIWKTELERVGPKLKSHQQLSANEWRAHVDQTITSKDSIAKLLSETQTDLQVLDKYVFWSARTYFSYRVLQKCG
jgi:estrogen-related receptor beta like 1